MRNGEEQEEENEMVDMMTMTGTNMTLNCLY